MYQVIKATYENGILKPTHHLPLAEQEQVFVVVLPWTKQKYTPTQPNQKRVALLREQAAAWLSQQPKDAVRPPLRLPEAQERKQNKEFDAALAAIRKQAKQISVEEIANDVNQALAEVRTLSPSERVHLETELDKFLAELDTYDE